MTERWAIPVKTQEPIQVTSSKKVQQDILKTVKLDTTNQQAIPPAGFRWDIVGGRVVFRPGATPDYIYVFDTRNPQLFTDILGIYSNNLPNNDYPLAFFIDPVAGVWTASAKSLPVIIRAPYAIQYTPGNGSSFVNFYIREYYEAYP
jgi:hypothetical protein